MRWLFTSFAWLALIVITALFIVIYLYSEGFAPGYMGWLFGGVAALCIWLTFWASKRVVSENKNEDERKVYRLNYQLIETLKAKEASPDVIYGLQKLVVQKGKRDLAGGDFLRELKEVFGPNRLKEVETTILTYAEAPPGTKPTPEEVPDVETETVANLHSPNGTSAQVDDIRKTLPEAVRTPG